MKWIFVFMLSELIGTNIFAQKEIGELLNSIPFLSKDTFLINDEYQDPSKALTKILTQDYFQIYQDSIYLDWESVNFDRYPISSNSLSTLNDYYLGKQQTDTGQTYLFIYQTKLDWRRSFDRIVLNIYNSDFMLVNQVIIANTVSFSHPSSGTNLKSMKSCFSGDSMIFKWKFWQNHMNSNTYFYYEKIVGKYYLPEIQRIENTKKLIYKVHNPVSDSLKIYDRLYFDF